MSLIMEPVTKKSWVPPIMQSVTKKPWVPPTVIVIPLPNNTSNNLSGDGDGDAALAHS